MGILDSLRPTVSIVATPNEFRFIGKEGEDCVRTLIRLNGDRKILGVGDAALDEAEGGTLISLFDRPSNASKNWFDADAFTRFCKYNVILASMGSLLLPTVRFTGARKFRTLFEGREAEMLAPPLRAAGVTRLEFED